MSAVAEARAGAAPADPPSSALSVCNLSFSYGERAVLDDVSFKIAPGQFTALVGPNGAGKTTLFLLVSRLLEPRPGEVAIRGLDVVRDGAAALASLGIVFQQPTLDLDLTVGQNLAYFAALHGIGRAEARARADATLAALDMAGSLGVRVRRLSGGQRRRVEIARALLHAPRLLLLDEPTVGLDIPTRRTLLAHAHAVAREQAVALLWATHLIDEIEERDHLIVLHRGRVVANATAAAIRDQVHAADLGEAYERLTGRGQGP